jgi:PAS domain S-box-containing protein
MPALVYTARERGNTFVNARYLEYTGLSADELMGDGWKRIVHPDDLDVLNRRGQGARSERTALGIELRLRRADGQWRWHLVRGLPDPADPTLWVGAMVDIHDRREAEARLAESEARYRAVVTSIEAGFSLVELRFDDEGCPLDYLFVEVNPAFERQTGLAGAVGRTARELIPNLEPHWFEIYGRVASTGEPVRFENGSAALDRWFDVYAVPVGDAAPYQVGILFNDISERRRAEEEVRHLNRNLEALVAERTRMLEESVSELDAFAYTVSHDLRAPLRAINGFTSMLGDEYAAALGDDGARLTTRISGAAERMERLIQDLLAYSRISREDLAPESVDLERLVNLENEDHEGLITAANAEVVVVRPLQSVMGNRTIVGQMIANLLTNGIKFVAEGTRPRLRIYAEEHGEQVRVCFEDNGIGIEPGHRERIFNVFERLHGQERFAGTGIGLAIVKKGAERLGGRVGVEASPSGGSRFWFELPKAGAARPK